MLPETPQTQPVNPAPLPGDSGQSSQTPAIPDSASQSLSEQVSVRAKELIAQHVQDPYGLSEALQQLKTRYLADHYHITHNPVDE